MTKFPPINWAKVIRIIEILLVVGLAIGLIYWEKFNYMTTYGALVSMFGKANWVQILSVTVVLTDVAALGKIVTPQTGIGEPLVVKILLVVWLAVTGLDAFLTWYIAAVEMEAAIIRIPSAIAEFAWFMPVIVAIISWGVSFGLLYSFGCILEGAIHKSPRPGLTSANSSYTPHVPSSYAAIPQAKSPSSQSKSY